MDLILILIQNVKIRFLLLNFAKYLPISIKVHPWQKVS